MAYLTHCLMLAIIVLADFSSRTAKAQLSTSACSSSWAMSPNTSTSNGIPFFANTVDLCQRACLLYSGCTGIDMSPNNECFLAGSWTTSRNNGSAQGFTHYDIISRGNCNTACSRSWAISPNTNTAGGIPNSAVIIDVCKIACLLYDGCTGFDWAQNNPAGLKCYLSGSWCTGRNNGSAQGVMHYDIIYSGNCNTDGPSILPAVMPPATTPGACFKSWTSSANTNTAGGKSDSAATVDLCKTACLMYDGCTGVDWALNSQQGTQCYLSGSWNTGRNNGSAQGVTHYDITSSGNCSPKTVSSASTIISPMSFDVILLLSIAAILAHSLVNHGPTRSCVY